MATKNKQSTEERIKELQIQYRLLSEIEELWGVKPSRHRAYLFVRSRMMAIIKELQSLNVIQ